MSSNKKAERRDMSNVTEKLYQLLSFSESSIIEEIDKYKKDEIRLNNDIMLFSNSDKRREWKKQHIKNVEKDLRKTVDHELPMTSVPRTGVGFFPVIKKIIIDRWRTSYTPIDIGADKKRCHNRLNKGRMDIEYLQQAYDEADGVEELHYVMESLVHRIQHGNNKRVEEANLYHGIKNVNETIEEYTEPTVENKTWRKYWREPLPKGYKQDQLKIVSNQLEKSWTVRRGQLNRELDLLKKNITRMERELEKISSLRKRAYKCAYKYGEQQNKVKSSYAECQSLMIHVKELARSGDTDKLMKVCHRQLFEGG